MMANERPKTIRMTSHEDFRLHRQDSTVSMDVRKIIGRKQITHDVREVHVSLINRTPNVPNIILHNLDRAIADLQELRNYVADNKLFDEQTREMIDLKKPDAQGDDT